MSPPSKRRALGRGLSALLPSAEPGDSEYGEPALSTSVAEVPAAPVRKDYFQAQIEDVYPNPEQPRRLFADPELDELAQSIRVHGVIQPLIVRKRPEGGYFLIAGERRWRASQRAGLHQVPVVVQEVAAKDAFERALVENLQRSDLNAIEEAEAYQRLVTNYRYTQEQVAERVGKERSTVTNSLRLLRLPPKVRRMVEDGDLSNGHAKALLSLDSAADIESAARAVIDKKLSVRATEGWVAKKKRDTETETNKTTETKPAKSANVRDLEERLTRSLGAQVQIREDQGNKSGRIEIRYLNLDDFQRLLTRLT